MMGTRIHIPSLKDGKKIILGPSRAEFKHKPSKADSCSFLSTKKFLAESKESGKVYMLLMREAPQY